MSSRMLDVLKPTDGLSITFPKADADALFREIAAAQNALGKSLGQAVRFAAWSVASTLGAATKVAKPYRPYVLIKESAGQRRQMGGRKLFEVTSYKTGSANKFKVRAASVRDLKQMPQVQIGQRGLAKMAWFWGIKEIGGGRNIGMGGTSQSARRSQNLASVRKQLSGDNPFVEIRNKLPYARQALKGGEAVLNSAMGTAARRMAHIIDGNIQKKMAGR